MERTLLVLFVFVMLCYTDCKGHKWWGLNGPNNNGVYQDTEHCFGGNEADLSCPDNYIIDVQWAIYKTLGWRRYCGDPTAFEKVKGLCNGLNSCKFTCDDQLFNETTCSQKTEKMVACYKCLPDPCSLFYCANGGKCILTDLYEPMCNCAGSWNGTNCDDNPCDGVMCNNGTCLVNKTDGTAQCCEEAMTVDEECPCDNTTCLNNGTCFVNDSGNAQCCCTEGFTGETCEEKVDACTLNPCQNGGVCSVNNLGLAMCNCSAGFGGDTCEIDCGQVQPCPTGFQELPPGSGNCYFFCPFASESWLSAQANCVSMGATLWEQDSEDEFNAVTGALTGTDKYWTGAFDGLTEGSTVFVGSGLPATLTTSGTNTVQKDCVELTRTSSTAQWLLMFRDCTVTTRRCICERVNSCNPTIPILPMPN